MRESIGYEKDFIKDTVTKHIKSKPDSSIAKGTTLIQLFNYESGELIKEVKSENIITDLPAIMGYNDFVTQAFIQKKPIYVGWVGDRSLDSNGWTYPADCPIAMMTLTDYKGEENPNDVMRGTIIGCAAATKAVNKAKSVLFGILNEIESSTTTENVDFTTEKRKLHIVVDFGTHACNGTFNTVYLHCNNDNSSGDFTKNNMYLGLDSLRVKKFKVQQINERETLHTTYGNGYILSYHGYGASPELNKVFIRKNILTGEETTYKLSELSYVKTGDVEARDVESAINAISEGNFAYDGINNVAYIMGTSSSNNYSPYNHVIIVDFKNKTYKVHDMIKDIKVSFKYKYKPFIFTKDGCLYAVYELETDDSKYITYISKYSTQMTVLNYGSNKKDNGSESFSSYTATQSNIIVYYGYTEDGNKLSEAFNFDCSFNSYLDYDNVGIAASPYQVYHDDIQAYTVNGKSGIYDYSLYYVMKPTTHNKLSAPITKTSANTMKVQYDIEYEVKHPFYKNPIIT